MPGATAVVGNFLLATFGGYSAAATAAAYFVAQVFVYASTTYLLGRAVDALSPDKRSRGGLGAGSEVNYYDSGAAIRIAYGQVRTGGMETIPPITSGEDRMYLHKVLTLVGHEVDSFNSVYFDNTEIGIGAIGPVTYSQSDGAVTSGDFKDYANIRLYRGTSTDSLDRILAEASSALYYNARGCGIAKAMFRFRYHDVIYRSVPTCTVTYQGKRCYDPRLDTSPGANPTNTSYIAWTQNPALCLCDYLMAVYGGEYDAEDIDWDTVVTAANYCDGTVSVPKKGGGTETKPRYTCNGILFATDPFEDNVKTLVDSMLGRVIFRDGKWRIYAGSWQTPTFTIQKEDWISGLSIKFERGRERRFNEMHCWYVDKERGWQRMESMPRSNATFKAADGGESIPAETEQLLCTNEYEAQRKSEMLLRQSRNQITVAGRLPPKFQNIALWETGYIVFDHLGWSSKTFRVVGIDINPDGSMDCVFTEEQSTDWTDMEASEYDAPSVAELPEVNGPFLPTVYTSQMEPNAATELFTASAKSDLVITTTATDTDPSDASNPYTQIIGPTFTPDADGDITCMWTGLIEVGPAGAFYYSMRLTKVGVSVEGHEYGAVTPVTDATLIRTIPFSTSANFSVSSGVNYNVSCRITKAVGASSTVLSINSSLLRVFYRKR